MLLQVYHTFDIAIGIIGVATAKLLLEQLYAVKVSGIGIVVINQFYYNGRICLIRYCWYGRVLPVYCAVGIAIKPCYRGGFAVVCVFENKSDSEFSSLFVCTQRNRVRLRPTAENIAITLTAADRYCLSDLLGTGRIANYFHDIGIQLRCCSAVCCANIRGCQTGSGPILSR